MTKKRDGCVGIFSNTFWSIYNFRRSLIKRLIGEGYRVIAISADDAYRERVEQLGCEAVVIKGFDAQSTSVFKEAGLIREIIWTLRTLPITYIYTFTIKPNLYTALTSSLTRKKVILTVNGLGNVFSVRGALRQISFELFKNAFRRAYRVVFQNKDDFAFFRERISLDPEKVQIVRGSGVNIHEFSFSEKPNAASSQLVFLLACRLLKEKGVSQYIQAARNVKASFPEIRFRLLGMEAKNPSAIRLADLKPYGDEGFIELLTQTDDVNGLLEQTDVLVLPSFYNEGIPRILLEGLSKGLPIITTNSVGCRETVVDNENGYLIEPRSAEALEESMRKMISLSPAERDSMRWASRRLAEAEFDENKVIDQYIAMIEQPASMVEKFTPNTIGAR